MEVRYFANIRDLTKETKTQFNGRAATLAALLRDLSARYGRPFEQRVFPNGQLDDTIIVLVNGRDIRHLNGIDTPLKETDVVAIFPVVAGGQNRY